MMHGHELDSVLVILEHIWAEKKHTTELNTLDLPTVSPFPTEYSLSLTIDRSLSLSLSSSRSVRPSVTTDFSRDIETTGERTDGGRRTAVTMTIG